MLDTLDKELGPLVQQLAKERNIHLILQGGPEAGIVYADATIDLTPAVIERFDAGAQ